MIIKMTDAEYREVIENFCKEHACSAELYQGSYGLQANLKPTDALTRRVYDTFHKYHRNGRAHLENALMNGWRGQEMKTVFDSRIRDYVTKWEGGEIRQDEVRGKVASILFGHADCKSALTSEEVSELAETMWAECDRVWKLDKPSHI